MNENLSDAAKLLGSQGGKVNAELHKDTLKERMSKAGKATREKYPIEVRREWYAKGGRNGKGKKKVHKKL